MGTVNQVVSTLHILQVLNQKNSMQIMGFRQGSNPSCLTVCSEGKNIYVAFLISMNMGHPSPAHLSCMKSISNVSAYSEVNAGQEHLSVNSTETGAARGAERARLQLTPSSAGATTEDGH